MPSKATSMPCNNDAQLLNPEHRLLMPHAADCMMIWLMSCNRTR